MIHLVKKPNTRNPLGWTPIQDAAKKGHTEIMEILTPFTKNPNKPTLFNWTPIQLAILGGHVEAFKVLDPYVDKPNAPSPGGWTPLQIAARDGHTEVVETLIRTRYPNAPAPDKWTPLQHAARNGKYCYSYSDFLISRKKTFCNFLFHRCNANFTNFFFTNLTITNTLINKIQFHIKKTSIYFYFIYRTCENCRITRTYR